jgi:hypothetical protein
MNKLMRTTMSVLIGAAILISSVGQKVSAADTTPALEPGTVSLSEIENTVYVRASAEAEEQLASNGTVLSEGGVVRTGALSSVRLDFSDGTIVRIKETSTFTVTSTPTSTNPLVALSTAVGKLWLILNGQAASVTTPAGVASVRGSMMSMSYNPAMGEIKVTCLETVYTCTVLVGGFSYELQPGTMLSSPPSNNPRIEPIDSGELREWLRYSPEASGFVEDLPYVNIDEVVIQDSDNDGVPNQFDNCPGQFNSDQQDTDSDGIGNVCDPFQTPPDPEPAEEDPCGPYEEGSVGLVPSVVVKQECPPPYEEEGPVT